MIFLVKFRPASGVNELQVFKREFFVWKQAVNMLSEISFLANNNETILTLDWGNAMEVLEKLDVFRTAERNGDREILRRLTRSYMKEMAEGLDNINLVCKVSTEEKHDPSQYVKQFMRLLYLSLNITEPGSGGLFAHISPIGEVDKQQKASSISISSEPFDYVEIPFRKYDFPPFRDLNFADTWSWLEFVGVKNESIAETNVQRALFALMNSSMNDEFLSPNGLLWLILGLEALYDLPSVGIASALRERIFLVLGAPKNLKKIKHLITESYEMRSKFVHGRMEIIIPLVGNAYLTNEITNRYEVPVWDASNFARAVLVSTLQKMISEGWINLYFGTSFSGTK